MVSRVREEPEQIAQNVKMCNWSYLPLPGVRRGLTKRVIVQFTPGLKSLPFCPRF